MIFMFIYICSVVSGILIDIACHMSESFIKNHFPEPSRCWFLIGNVSPPSIEAFPVPMICHVIVIPVLFC